MTNRDLTPWRRSVPTGYGADPFSSFRREMDRLFEDFLTPATEGRSFGAAAGSTAMLRPDIDVEENEQAYVVSAELPGLSEQDIELNLHDNALTISGEKKSERKEEKAGRRYTERSFGRFERTIPFPAEVDSDRVDASFRNGVLTVTLPKNEKARDKTRRIEVRAGGPGNGGQRSPTHQ
ncbi:MAG TPA: Hsp20/alpha crystallin family protein [Phenylobacterium sp.]|nr:Hsp20/alpha crystallin family protein [Phenylobacterium sp.]